MRQRTRETTRLVRMHLLAPRACNLAVFIEQQGLPGIQITEAPGNLPIEATENGKNQTAERALPELF